MKHLRYDDLTDYLHAALPPERDAEIYAHLEQCAPCRSAYDAEVSLTEALRAHAGAEERELPGAVKAEIWNRIRAAQPSPLARFGALWRPAIAVPVAAAIALAAYFGTTYVGPHGAPSIAAAYYLQDHAALGSTVPFSDRTLNPVDLENESAAATQQTAVRVDVPAYTADAN